MANQSIVFPGQGAQAVGMGKDFYDAYSASRDVFEKACEAIQVDLIKLCFEGPQEALNETDICQPAILTASIAMLAGLQAELKTDRFEANCTAGLSLGEYTSLVFAQAISFEEGVRLVRQRGLFMMDACRQRLSSMASVLGLSREDCEDVCREASSLGIVTVANINSPKQIVLSGEIQPLELAGELARQRGARRVIPLAVSGAFHSECMVPAAVALAEEIDSTEFHDAKIPVITNVDGQGHQEYNTLRQKLKDQLTHPVEWVESMNFLAGRGVRQVVEIGPGRVLSGLMKSIHPDMACASIHSLESMNRVLQEGLLKT